MARPRRVLSWAVVVAAVLCVSSSAFAAATLPKPGTASQVAALVAASSSIKRLPTGLVPALSQVAGDSPGAYYPSSNHECSGMTKCVFGDVKSDEVVVLFGDSHAQMWLPALAPVFRSARERLVLIWKPGCPDATVGVWEAYTHSINVGCNDWRSEMIADIHAADPTLVLLADRTSDIPGANNRLIANSTWESGLETTISDLKSSTTQVAVVQDVTILSLPMPECLAAHPNSIQACSVKNPNPKTHQHFAAELAAADAEDVPYVTTQQWLCTTRCSPVVGKLAAYFDQYHVSSTYAEYLSNVWALELKKLSLLPT
jgi:hypothetical protein